MTFVQVAQFLVSLSLLIILHEMGHFFPARWFRTRVEKFYLFFDPYFSLFKKKIGETEYGIGWLPLGGYVKISGMMDESMDKDQMNQPPQPWEFRSKKTWQRLIIMIGGVTVNLILAMMIYIGLFYKHGSEYIEPKNITSGIHIVDSLGYMMGLKEGDIIIGTEKGDYKSFNEFGNDLLINRPKNLRLVRENKEIVLGLKEKDMKAFSEIFRKTALITPKIPIIIKEVQKKTKNTNLLKANDTIIGIGNKYTPYYSEFTKELEKYKMKNTTIRVIRGQDTLSIKVAISKKGRIGIALVGFGDLYKITREEYTFFESVKLGVMEPFNIIGSQIKAFSLMFSGGLNATDTMGGFGSIMSAFDAETWDWRSFWGLTAMLSAVLAFMNILPIPALDGGHVLFLIYEMIFRKAPSEKFMTYAQVGGMIFLFSLIIFVNGLDVFRAEWFQRILHFFSGS